MKKRILSFLMILLLAAVTASAGATAETAVSPLAGLSTVDMDGNAVDASIFADAELTVLHVWATDCSPCIAEMPDIAAWSEELPENVQVIGLIFDVLTPDDPTFSRARKILDLSGASFVNLLNNDTLNPLTDMLIGTPTTYFLDTNGNFVDSPVLGAYLQAYMEKVDRLLSR